MHERLIRIAKMKGADRNMCNVAGCALVITGASGQLGQAIAAAARAGNARLLLLDRVADRLPLETDTELPMAVDVSDPKSCDQAVARGIAKFGRIDSLVNVIGGYRGGVSTLDSDWTLWEQMLSVNLRSAVNTTRALLPHFLERGAGSIVNIGTMAALQGPPGEAAYAGAKAALLRFTESVAMEHKGKGIRANAVLPGAMDTEANRAWMSETERATAVSPSAIAEVVLFLASDAARAVTGATVRATGAQ